MEPKKVRFYHEEVKALFGDYEQVGAAAVWCGGVHVYLGTCICPRHCGAASAWVFELQRLDGGAAEQVALMFHTNLNRLRRHPRGRGRVRGRGSFEFDPDPEGDGDVLKTWQSGLRTAVRNFPEMVHRLGVWGRSAVGGPKPA